LLVRGAGGTALGRGEPSEFIPIGTVLGRLSPSLRPPADADGPVPASVAPGPGGAGDAATSSNVAGSELSLAAALAPPASPLLEADALRVPFLVWPLVPLMVLLLVVLLPGLLERRDSLLRPPGESLFFFGSAAMITSHPCCPDGRTGGYRGSLL
jgi:hypothetical protein